MAVDPSEPGAVWALTSAGLAGSDDAGVSWQPASALDDLEGQPLALAAGPGVLWVATDDPRALYSSTDGGTSWERIAGS